MAAILHSSTQESRDQDFMKLKSNPMFTQLQDVLRSHVENVAPKVPLALAEVKEEPGEVESSSLDPSVVAVQEANLQSDFQQIIPTGNKKAQELRDFYTIKCSEIENERNAAIFTLKENNMLSVSQYQRQLDQVHVKFDEQRMHLTNRVTASLQLLKISIPAECEVSSSKAKSRQLNSRAVAIMTDWYERHIDNPYPSDDDKQALADLGNLSLSQVKAWFANKRNRTNNTKPKKQKLQVERKLLSICTELSGEVPRTTPRMYGEIIQQLSDIVNSSHVFGRLPCAGTRQPGQQQDSYNSSGDELETSYQLIE